MEIVDEKFVRSNAIPAPWERDNRDVAYAETGRQALGFVAEQLWNDGYRTLLVPEFLCDSMLAPFLALHPWIVVPVAVDIHFAMDLGDLEFIASQVDGPFVALMALYFGRLPDDHYRAAVHSVQCSGGVVIDDETHRLFAPGDAGADISIASLRKLLPVADGAYIGGRFARMAAESQFEEGPHGRWAAMELKSRYFAGHASARSVREAFSIANKSLEQIGMTFRVSARTVATVGRLNYTDLAAARSENSRVLQRGLTGAPGLRIINPIESVSIPSHIVIDGVDAQVAQQALSVRGVYCSIHWPPSELLAAKRPWPRSCLSVPIDHRYNNDDMTRVAQVIREVWSS